jgi:hypothetical protein
MYVMLSLWFQLVKRLRNAGAACSSFLACRPHGYCANDFETGRVYDSLNRLRRFHTAQYACGY